MFVICQNALALYFRLFGGVYDPTIHRTLFTVFVFIIEIYFDQRAVDKNGELSNFFYILLINLPLNSTFGLRLTLKRNNSVRQTAESETKKKQ